MSATFLYLLLGLLAGVFSGLVGIGGGILVVPALIYFFGFSQHQAQGTTLAMMIPPIGILAAWSYYTQGYVNIKVAVLLALGFLLGGLFGAQIAFKLSNATLSKVFGLVMITVGLKLFLTSK